MTLVLDTAFTLVLLLAVYGPLERLWPARRQPWLRPNLLVDLQFYLGQAFVFGAVATIALGWFRQGIDFSAPLALREVVRAQPAWAQALLAVVLGDLSVYWFHRASHRYAWLWRFHRVHHTSAHLDWLAAHREHPVDGLLTQLAINGPAMLLGVPFALLVPLAVFRGLWAIFIHSNARLPLGPLRYVLGAPELHHWHHAKHPGRVTNFANLAPWCDVLFGTFHLPSEVDERWDLGDPEPSPESWWRLLLEPLGFPRKYGRVAPGESIDVSACG